MATIQEFKDAVGASEEWVDDLKRRLGWQHSERVWPALLAALHALRDDLRTDAAVRLGAGLPPLLRGFYYEGWLPRDLAAEQESREAFFSRIHEGVHRDLGVDPEQLSHAVFALLAKRLPSAELEEIRAASPAELRGLWPA